MESADNYPCSSSLSKGTQGCYLFYLFLAYITIREFLACLEVVIYYVLAFTFVLHSREPLHFIAYITCYFSTRVFYLHSKIARFRSRRGDESLNSQSSRKNLT